jgi:hypothetical protein
MPEPGRSRVFAVRKGEVDQRDVLDEIAELEDTTKRALARSALPDRPDTTRINSFLAEAYQIAWARGQHAKLRQP